MSIRVRIIALFGLLISLMTLMNRYSITSPARDTRSPAKLAGILVIILTIISLIILIGFILEWRDPFRKDEKTSFNPFRFLGTALGGIVLFGIIQVVMKVSSPSKMPTNNTSNPTPAGLHGHPVGQPLEHNGSVFQTANRTFPTNYLLYAVLGVIIAVLAYFAVSQYREYLQKKRREELRLRAEAFDRRLETGLESFSNPTEAVIGMYKNAILWLEYLGLPYKESWTHWEHAARVNYRRKAFLELTKLFEKAKYAPEKVTWDDAKRALDLYLKLRGELNET